MKEISNLRALIARDLADALVPGLSADRCFATAYNAALQAAAIVVACSGYRVNARAGHHAVTFEVAGLAIGATALPFTDYFDMCRRKRNLIDYDRTSAASSTEAEELTRKVKEFVAVVEGWVSEHHPSMAL